MKKQVVILMQLKSKLGLLLHLARKLEGRLRQRLQTLQEPFQRCAALVHLVRRSVQGCSRLRLLCPLRRLSGLQSCKKLC